MGTIRRSFAIGTLFSVCTAATTGCSLLFVKGPPHEPNHTRAVACTSSRVAPIVDSIFGGLEVARMGLDFGASDQAFQAAPISRTADIAIGLTLATVFIGSAIYGYIATEACDAATEQKTTEEGSPTEGRRPDVSTASTPGPRTAFDFRAAKAAVEAAFAEAARRCGVSGKRVATLTYRSDGHVLNVVFAPPFEDAIAGSCAEKAARAASVPAFDGDEFVVKKGLDFAEAQESAKVDDAGVATTTGGGTAP